ncbi:MAG: rRNA maturation RNase YbeY [Steroidobacteraceae bacterium]
MRRAALAVECRGRTSRTVPPMTRITRWARAALGARGAGCELALQIVGPARMRELNHHYRGKDRPTNVLSFPAAPAPGVQPQPLGDVVICPAVLQQEARAQGKPAEAHWAHLVVHGVLHLAGYDHEIDADARRMERREIAVLRGLGFPNPYIPRDAAPARVRAGVRHV